VIKTETVIIDGQEAIRAWKANTLGSGSGRSISTYVRYNDQETIVINSDYSIENEADEAAIERVHNSLDILQ
jgi:hypothetical protein